MARYTTVLDYVSFFGSDELAQLLCDEQGELDADVLSHFIQGHEQCPSVASNTGYCYTDEQWAEAQQGVDRYELIAAQVCNHIDGKIGQRYSLPLSTADFEASSLRRCATMLSRCMLMDDDDNSSERSEGEVKSKQVKFDTCPYWDQWLDRVGEGGVDLGSGIMPIPSDMTTDPASRISFGLARSALDKHDCGCERGGRGCDDCCR